MILLQRLGWREVRWGYVINNFHHGHKITWSNDYCHQLCLFPLGFFPLREIIHLLIFSLIHHLLIPPIMSTKPCSLYLKSPCHLVFPLNSFKDFSGESMTDHVLWTPSCSLISYSLTFYHICITCYI